ncbi:DNA polymerase III subunit gamma/tau [Pelagibacterium halotolerans]|uniref:DNA polymerase III subunit gamma/tau n=1 Tax=Pelagibacterium halotolerans (strain DSM 22347 / JCM 15775 / CGMCC 1.7692 / B2) TaxID=1082931 RepID=G4RFT3_PELHB|nr:DNA polymerase III subunit gamma/tau [Pelagibacterium halotolerans]AEQ50097.1 DNA polymerase III subunits gamma and tau [Pelagibacterium halotolerans B2]QJR19888.1 DNA polymerase III subunit gamma/tau [Pelagibacterium halotolerans]
MVIPPTPATPYQVLARKYRPSSFESLVGQDAMVQTLGNAFATGRIHHAFILTGVRGVGKTTTARILARAFNYADETGAHPTLDLSKEGVHCAEIIAGTHVDVMEMDAASNTGIDSIREINAMTRTPPMSAPYKVFIIDEVHMLSTSAFNGLLKTLEEPPPYVKFIFATTEIRKVPVTILSRCMRFDLRRISPEVMTGYLSGLLEKESIPVEPEALSMIVRAGEGSARDCLSLTDQAIAHGGGEISVQSVRDMLGLADRARIIDLFEKLMGGDIAGALDDARALYDSGADPTTIITDLAELTHLVTRIKIVPSATDDPVLTPDERSRGAELAQRLALRVLTRTWQILSKGLTEIAQSGNGLQSAEMVLIRLAYAADLPSPDELIERLTNQPTVPGPAPSAPAPNGGGGYQARAMAPSVPPGPAPQQVPSVEARTVPQSYEQIVVLAGEKRDIAIKHALESDIKPVSFEVGRIEVALTPTANPSVVSTLSARLKEWTGRPWLVTISTKEIAAPTLREARRAAEDHARDAALEDPLVKAVMETFPGARLVNIKSRPDLSSELETAADDFETPVDPEEDE